MNKIFDKTLQYWTKDRAFGRRNLPSVDIGTGTENVSHNVGTNTDPRAGYPADPTKSPRRGDIFKNFPEPSL